MKLLRVIAHSQRKLR